MRAGQELIESFKQFEAMVETMVDLSLIDQHEYRIRPDFDDDLKEFYKGLQKSKQKMEDLRSRVRFRSPRPTVASQHH